jgi:glutathione S-transferase
MEISEIVDVETARASRGVRMVVASVVPSPWSEAAKNVFHLAGVKTQWVRATRGDAAIAEWTRAHNSPVVFHDDDPPRDGWAEIVTLAARLAKRPIVPTEPEARARTFGLLHELAGEDGLAWSGRLLMIDYGLRTEGARGFPVQVSRYLAAKYGYAPDRIAGARARVREGLALFDRLLTASPSGYLAGDAPGALDVYLASFLAPIVGVTDSECPGLRPEFRAAFSTLKDDADLAVSPAVLAHRARMYAEHLPFPIRV